jgi:hypothetical protein
VAFVHGVERKRRRTMMPNKITSANAGGPRRLPIRAPFAARIAEFCR